MITVYHNPRCSKSRNTLALLDENGVDYQLVLYLEDTPTADTMKRLIEQLSITPRQLLRTSEDAYKQHNLANLALSDDAIIEAMVSSPKLIERPIVTDGTVAVLGRPPENVLALLNCQ